MTVPEGMAKVYYAAQKRKSPDEPKPVAAVPGCPPCASTPVKAAADADAAPKIARLQDHPGLHTLRDVIGQAATVSGVDRFLISAVIAIESGFQKDARSPKGALGLMQLMPQTAVSLVSVKNIETALVDPATNVGAGARHLRRLIDMYPGRLDLALAAYNAGEGAVAKYAGIPPFAETQAYVRKVMALHQLYEAAYIASKPVASKLVASQPSASHPATAVVMKATSKTAAAGVSKSVRDDAADGAGIAASAPATGPARTKSVRIVRAHDDAAAPAVPWARALQVVTSAEIR
jgi:hypothetical protein